MPIIAVAAVIGVLTLALICLKLAGLIGWSWMWVLAPVWITWGLGVVLVLAVVLVGAGLE